MGSSLVGRSASRAAGTLELAEKLLQRVSVELEHADRPLPNLAGRRCILGLIEVCEQIEAQRPNVSGVDSIVGCLRSSRYALSLVHRCGAIVPSAYESLRAGYAVLERRIRGGHGGGGSTLEH